MRIFLYLLIWLFCWSHTLGQQPEPLCERIYLQTDKQLYLSGEVIWCKVLTTTPEKIPLSFSKIVYIELLDESTSHQQAKIGLSDGVGDGWIKLSPNLPTGYYRLIAYTRFMRNEGTEVFFEKEIGIVNTFQSVPANPAGKIQEKTVLSAMEPVNTIDLSTNQSTYHTRERGWLQLDHLPANIHNLSVSITGKSTILIPEYNIFQWGEQIKPPIGKFSGKFIPEYEGHIVTGKIVPFDNQGVLEENINSFLCIPGENPRLFVGKRNQADISFYLTDISGLTEVVTTSDKNYRIDIQSAFIQQYAKEDLPFLAIDSAQLGDLLKRSVALQVLPSSKKDSVVGSTNRNTYFHPEPSKTYLLDEYTRFPKMDELIIEFVLGVRFWMKDGKRELSMAVKRGNEQPWITPLVLLDGIPIKDHELIYRYNPLLVKKIDVYMKEYLFGGIRYEGIIAFSTYKHHYPELVLDKTYQILDYTGVQAHFQIQIPEYGNDNVRQSREPDFRHTLLWNPAIQVVGKSSIQIPFNTSDYNGEFLVTVEGLTKNGEQIYARYNFSVK